MSASCINRRRRAFVPILFLAASWSAAAAPTPTVADAKAFLEKAEAQLLSLSVDSSRADWVKSTYITDDTETIAARADEKAIGAQVQLAKDATRFDRLKLPEDLARKMMLLKVSLVLATPAGAKDSEELTNIVSKMEGLYGKGKYCPSGPDKCLDLEELSTILRTSTDPRQLLDAWKGWHKISPPIRPLFERYVALANKGAKEIGFADTGALWRSRYDMPPDAFARGDGSLMEPGPAALFVAARLRPRQTA